MLTMRKSLSLSGGHIIADHSMSPMIPSYSPNAPSGQHFPWEEDVDVINTPDIDPSFFNDDPFKKLQNTTTPSMEFADDNLMACSQKGFIEDTTSQQSLDENLYLDLSQLISQTNPENTITESVTNESLVSPNDVFENVYIPATTAPVLHYLQPKQIESIVPTVSIPVITSNKASLDSKSSHSTHESFSLLHCSQESLESSPRSSQSYSPAMSTTSQSYLDRTSPALSYTSSTTHSHIDANDTISSDSNAIDMIFETIDTKPELAYLQPTVINDHLYTLPTSISSKRKSSADSNKDNKYLSVRKRNNMASKKSRITKRDKQKLMEEQIKNYIDDNAKCKEMIAQMEKEIAWCKNYLFKKVVARN